MIEKYVLKEEQDIIAFEFLPIKPLGKASSGSMINNGILVALKNG